MSFPTQKCRYDDSCITDNSAIIAKINKVCSRTADTSSKKGITGSKVSPLVCAAIFCAAMTQKQPAKQLTGSDVRVVGVTEEANLSASREEKPATTTLVLYEEIDVSEKPANTRSLNPFDNIDDAT